MVHWCGKALDGSTLAVIPGKPQVPVPTLVTILNPPTFEEIGTSTCKLPLKKVAVAGCITF